MAYAAVVSVKQTIRSLLTGNSDSDKKFKSILADLCSVQSVLESVSYLEGGERDDTHRRNIKVSASELEDLIRSESENLRYSPELILAKDNLVHHAKVLKMARLKPSDDDEDEQASNSLAGDAGPMRRKKETVGLASELSKIRNCLVGGERKLDVISIVGRSGIGKTTLAKEIYDSDVSRTFEEKFFVTVGQRYELKEFRLFLMDHMGIHITGVQNIRDIQIGVELHQALDGRKYLIVLDDVRNIQAWKDLKNLLPEDRIRGSRIIVTTTQQDVACNASGTEENIFRIPSLDVDQSWTLLKQMTFSTGGTCPFKLEMLGQKIAKNCDGLPRAICSIANSLREDMTEEHWSRASQDIYLQSTTRDNSAFLEAYKQLPSNLKKCFLYMGVFPPSYDIPVSKLLKLWIAEELIEPESGRLLEETARSSLDALVSRNLVSVCEQTSRGLTKSCRIHFLDRNICVDQAQRENFFHVISKYEDSSKRDLESQSRLCILNNIVLAIQEVNRAIKARSLLCVGPRHQHPLPLCLNKKIKVLDALSLRFHVFPKEVLELVDLKYLAITCDGNLPPSISNLKDLQVLIVHLYQGIMFSDTPVYLPAEIWELRKLKHLECMGFDMQDHHDESLILEELLTLAGVGVYSCTQGVFARIPNLLKLKIWIESTRVAAKAFSFFQDSLATCRALDSFKCHVMIRGPLSRATSPIPAFPGAENLKKITLNNCRFRWEHMKNLGALPNLEVLKLRCNAFCGTEWDTKRREFLKLKFLLFEDLDIEEWSIDDEYDVNTEYEEHFPELEHLIIRHCYKLLTIPEQVIDFIVLKTIELDQCNQSATVVARRLEEQHKETGSPELFNIHCTFMDATQW